MLVRQGKLPRRRHQIDDVFKFLVIDVFGPLRKVCSLHRSDKRHTKIYVLLAVCQLSGLLAVELMADASTSSIVIALQTMQCYTGDVYGLRMDAGSALVPFSKFNDKDDDEDNNGYEGEENDEMEDMHDKDKAEHKEIKKKLDQLQEYALKNNMSVDVSPPKKSEWQGLCERNIGLIKEMLSFEPQRNLHVLELQSLIKRCVYILNCRPVIYSENKGCVLSRFDLLSLRNKSGTNPEIFNKPMSIIDAGEFQKHVDEMEKLLDQFWDRYRELTIEAMLKVQQSRFSGEIIPQLHDLVGVPDKVSRVHGVGIGEIVEILPAHDNEKRVCRVRLARKSKRSHPFPLSKSSTKLRTFLRGTDKLIFLMRRKPQSEDEKKNKKLPYNHFLYDELVGKSFLNQDINEGEGDEDISDDDESSLIDVGVNHEGRHNEDDIPHSDVDTDEGEVEDHGIDAVLGDDGNSKPKLVYHRDSDVESITDLVTTVPKNRKKKPRK